MAAYAEIILVMGLVLLNGFFAMAEMSLVSSRRSKLQELAARRVRGAAVALDLSSNPGSFLSTVQIGITLIGVLAGAISGATLADRFGAWLDGFAIVRPYGATVSITIIVAAITYVSLVIGELVPKQVALSRAEAVAIRIAPVMRIVARFARPVVLLLQGSTRFVLALLGVSATAKEGVSEAEVRALVREGADAGVFAPQEHAMVSEVMRLDARPVTTIMTPRHDVVMLAVDAGREQVIEVLGRGIHSRFPVYEGALDNIVGIVSARRLLEQALGGGAVDVRTVMREPIVVPKSARVLDVLQVFMTRRPHMAVIVDEYASVQGIVTPSDILETITGDLADGEVAGPSFVQRQDGSWLVDGAVELLEVDERIGTALGRADPYRSLAAFLLHAFKKLPAEGDSIEVGGCRFEIADLDGRRIDKVIVHRLSTASSEADPV
ncbi:MAG: HlyC/CorC family transporter [Alphaproteobacteria bacterium]|nr:HlyC/CorC family transporter [Alphaproteobacteria bacterium]